MLAGGVRTVMLAIKPNPTNPVTLNLFQGPSGRKPGSSGRIANRSAWCANARFGRGEKWILKQVQDDDAGEGAHRG
jgi:hypothetical protein